VQYWAAVSEPMMPGFIWFIMYEIVIRRSRSMMIIEPYLRHAPPFRAASYRNACGIIRE
jgi:hypothetical protein